MKRKKLYVGRLGPYQPRKSRWLHRYHAEDDIPRHRPYWCLTRKFCGLYLTIMGRWYLEWLWI